MCGSVVLPDNLALCVCAVAVYGATVLPDTSALWVCGRHQLEPFQTREKPGVTNSILDKHFLNVIKRLGGPELHSPRQPIFLPGQCFSRNPGLRAKIC